MEAAGVRAKASIPGRNPTAIPYRIFRLRLVSGWDVAKVTWCAVGRTQVPKYMYLGMSATAPGYLLTQLGKYPVRGSSTRDVFESCPSLNLCSPLTRTTCLSTNRSHSLRRYMRCQRTRALSLRHHETSPPFCPAPQFDEWIHNGGRQGGPARSRPNCGHGPAWDTAGETDCIVRRIDSHKSPGRALSSFL